MLVTDQHIYIGSIIIGAFSAIPSIFIFRGTFSAKQWKTAAGIITEASVKMSEGGFDLDSQTSSDKPMYYPYVEYSFEAKGRRQRGKNIGFTVTHTTNKKSVEKMVEKYYKGRKVTVYYNPRRPDQSVLDKSVPKLALISTAMIILCIEAFGIAGLLGFIPPILR